MMDASIRCNKGGEHANIADITVDKRREGCPNRKTTEYMQTQFGNLHKIEVMRGNSQFHKKRVVLYMHILELPDKKNKKVLNVKRMCLMCQYLKQKM